MPPRKARGGGCFSRRCCHGIGLTILLASVAAVAAIVLPYDWGDDGLNIAPAAEYSAAAAGAYADTKAALSSWLLLLQLMLRPGSVIITRFWRIVHPVAQEAWRVIGPVVGDALLRLWYRFVSQPRELILAQLGGFTVALLIWRLLLLMRRRRYLSRARNELRRRYYFSTETPISPICRTPLFPISQN